MKGAWPPAGEGIRLQKEPHLVMVWRFSNIGKTKELV